MPAGVCGCVVRIASALNCAPNSLSTTQRPVASTSSPATAEAKVPTSVTSSLCPFACTRSTAKPLSGL
jgi:hypothetical protein